MHFFSCISTLKPLQPLYLYQDITVCVFCIFKRCIQTLLGLGICSIMNKLAFRVSHFSGEDAEYRAIELNAHTPETKGWQTQRFCEYPQELGFQVSAVPDAPAGSSSSLAPVSVPQYVSQIQILSHQCKVATKIEIYVGIGDRDYHTATFTRLGSLQLDPNERSSYQARELKTVYINRNANFIRMVIHNCHINKYNLFNQVGIVAINVFGDVADSDSGSDSNSPKTADNGFGRSFSKIERRDMEDAEGKDLNLELTLEKTTAAKLQLLVKAKADAIHQENYALAKLIKSTIKDVEKLGVRLAQLEVAKRRAVEVEDFDKASELKVEIETLKDDVDKLIILCIPSMAAPKIEPPAPERYFIAETQTTPVPTPRETKETQMTPVPSRSSSRFFVAETQTTPAPTPRETKETQLTEFTPHTSRLPSRLPSRTSSRADMYDQFYNEDAKMDAKSIAPHSPVVVVEDKASGPSRPSTVRAEEKSEADLSEFYNADAKSLPRQSPAPSEPKAEPEPSFIDDDASVFVQEPVVMESASESRVIKPKVDESYEHEDEDKEELGVGMEESRELPEPDEWDQQARDYSDQSGISQLIGEYLARSLYSKSWSLRETAIVKTDLKVKRMEFDDTPGYDRAIQPITSIIQNGLEDKTPQVFLTALTLLDSLLAALKRNRIHASVIKQYMESIVNTLMDKLNDGSARIRDSSTASLLAISQSALGPGYVAAAASRPLGSKQRSLWRPLVGRLHLLKDLVRQNGIGGQMTSAGITADSIMGFCKNNGAFAHSNGEVREAAKALTVTIQEVVGTTALEPYLKILRPKQLEEYYTAFDSALIRGQKDVKIVSATAGGSSPSVQAVSVKKQKPPDSSDQVGTCMFCGRVGLADEDALDLHYWQECPLLCSCVSCGQVIEISVLSEHQLTECEGRANYRQCEVTGVAVETENWDEWQDSAKRVPIPNGSVCCPLCKDQTQVAERAWRQHCCYGCEGNKRGEQ